MKEHTIEGINGPIKQVFNIKNDPTIARFIFTETKYVDDKIEVRFVKTYTYHQLSTIYRHIDGMMKGFDKVKDVKV